MFKTLLTGGGGLVGSEFKNPSYIKPSSKEYDLRDRTHVEELFANNNFDNVIHCAAKVGGLGSNMASKGEYFHDNVMMNTNVIDVARQYGVDNLVIFLSTCIFPHNVSFPLTEEKVHAGPPHDSNFGYAYAKRMGEVQVRTYREQYGVNYKSVIPCNIYGPNDNYNLEHGHVIPSLIHKCYLAKENNSPFVIWGTGEPLREFIYSADVAKLVEWVLFNYNEPEPIILSTSQEISIKNLAHLIAKEMDFTGDIVWDRYKPDGELRKPSDNKKIKKYLPDFKFTPIEEGIKKTVKHFIEKYDQVRK